MDFSNNFKIIVASYRISNEDHVYVINYNTLRILYRFVKPPPEIKKTFSKRNKKSENDKEKEKEGEKEEKEDKEGKEEKKEVIVEEDDVEEDIETLKKKNEKIRTNNIDIEIMKEYNQMDVSCVCILDPYPGIFNFN